MERCAGYAVLDAAYRAGGEEGSVAGYASAGAGYQQISLFAKAEYAPAHNTLYRVLSPIVFLLVTASVLYAVSLDRFVAGYWRVTVFYFAWRWLFNIALERARLKVVAAGAHRYGIDGGFLAGIRTSHSAEAAPTARSG